MDAHTLWMAAKAWWIDQHDALSWDMLRRTRVVALYVYVEGEDWCYYLTNPKLYRMEPEETPFGSFLNCDQDGLREHADRLGHVIMRDRITRDERYWGTFEAFAEEIGIPAPKPSAPEGVITFRSLFEATGFMERLAEGEDELSIEPGMVRLEWQPGFSAVELWADSARILQIAREENGEED